ncbi:MAG: CYTH domain-containing protein [Bacteroidetes bacterium]|nr:CYTH domain-containing protein [Bacteroidota bacterium]MBL6962813.1 CYTH domain-containing protein [Bacteroidota bacterium]
MGIEIERKYLLKNDSWKKDSKGTYIHQGYLNRSEDRTVRIRIAGSNAYVTIKGKSQGISRSEFEYEIPVKDAQTMLDTLCEQTCIEKHRYQQTYGQHVWQIDEFHGDNQGLFLAEIELSMENEKFEIPPWIGKEVSGNPRYFNSNLSKHPFTKW